MSHHRCPNAQTLESIPDIELKLLVSVHDSTIQPPLRSPAIGGPAWPTPSDHPCLGLAPPSFRAALLSCPPACGGCWRCAKGQLTTPSRWSGMPACTIAMRDWQDSAVGGWAMHGVTTHESSALSCSGEPWENGGFCSSSMAPRLACPHAWVYGPGLREV